jgi:integrase
MAVVDRWHLSRPTAGTPTCREHGLVPSPLHGHGDRWQVRYRDDQGRQRKRNFPKKTGTDPDICATAFAAKVTDQLNTDIYIDPARGKVTLRTYGEQWRSALTCDPATMMQITSRLNVHVYPSIGDQPMGVLAKRPSLIQQWIKGLEGHLAPSTIKGIVGWVSTMFKAAIDDGVVTRNPCELSSVRRPKVQARKPTPWDLPRLVSVVAEMPASYRAMVYLGAGCGHRQGELFGVAAADIDWLGQVVHVRRQVRIIDGVLVFSLPKGGKQRSVPLPESVGLRLSAHIAEHATAEVTLLWGRPGGGLHTAALLFTATDGGALDRNGFNRVWRSARRSARVADTRDNGVHVLRHTAASAWLAAGVDIRTVAEYLGHTDPGFTLRTYTHLMPDSADRARKAMEAFFADESPSALIVPSGGAR